MVFYKHTIGGAKSSPLPPSANGFGQDFFAGHGVYDEEKAKLLSAIAGWSYSDLETFRDKIANTPGLAGSDFLEISVTNDPMLVVAAAQIIRTPDKKAIIVCFRGTQLANIVNWLTDAGTRKVNFHDVNVHSGFLRNFKEVWEGYKGILEHLRRPFMLNENFDKYDDEESRNIDMKDPKSEQPILESIYVTGHSLGGAMAFLAGLELQHLETEEEDPLWAKVRGIYTYGQPMVIDNHGKTECERRIGGHLFRHVYYNDIVPHLPPLSTGQFDHIGFEFRFKPGQGWTSIEDSQRVTQVVSILLTAPFGAVDAILSNVQWLSFLKMPWSFLDHSPVGYIEHWQDEGSKEVQGVGLK